MYMYRTDVILLIITIVVLVIDIALAFLLRFVLPEYMTTNNHYPSDDSEVSFATAISYCVCLAKKYPTGTDSKIQMKEKKTTTAEPPSEETPNEGKKKRSLEEFTSEYLDKYPFVVSLSTFSYADDPEEKIFICNGLIESSDWLLTSQSCLQNESQWLSLTIRSGSPFWSKLGHEHSVTNVSIEADGFVRLQVFPKFDEKLIPKPPIRYPFSGDWVHATVLGWDEDMYKKGLKFRFKYKPFDIVEWTSRPCGSEFAKVCYKPENCRSFSSKPLLSSCHELIGMQSKCDENFSSLSPEYTLDAKVVQEKECYKISKDFCQTPELDVCPLNSFR